MSDIFVARQPIFDRELDVAGYELLFRGANENVAIFSDHDEATSTVVACSPCSGWPLCRWR